MNLDDAELSKLNKSKLINIIKSNRRSSAPNKIDCQHSDDATPNDTPLTLQSVLSSESSLNEIKISIDFLRKELAESFNKQVDRLHDIVNSQQENIRKLEATINKLELKIERLEPSKDAGANSETPATSYDTSHRVWAPTEVIQSSLREIMAEEKEKERKKDNIIMFAASEPTTNNVNDRKNQDEKLIRDVFECIEVSDVNFQKCIRLGKASADKTRPILITVGDKLKRAEILKNAKKLRQLGDGNPLKNVIIKPDQTKLELEQEKKLVKELKVRKEKGETDIFIRNGKIIQGKPRNRED